MNIKSNAKVEIRLKYCLRVYSGNTCVAMAKPDFLSGKHRLEISALEKEIVVKY